MSQNALSFKPGLYVTATPIGNLGDMTYRAVEAMKAADLILCEDTRQTAKLCAAYDIKTPRAAYHDHNAAKVRPDILEKLRSGAMICLASDAGTPLIADPGYKLVRDAREAGIDVFPLPGASALTAALSAAGAPTDRFTFGGFPPARAAAREKFFSSFLDDPGALVFYETGPRLADSLAAMARAFGGERRASIARELTKLHEEFRSGALAELAAAYEPAAAKGEIVVIVFPQTRTAPSSEEIDGYLTDALTTKSVKDAAADAAETFGIRKRTAYDRALALKGKT